MVRTGLFHCCVGAFHMFVNTVCSDGGKCTVRVA